MRISILVFFIFLISCAPQSSSTSGWQKVYKNDEHGIGQFGDKQDLLDAARLGYPIRIGFGSNRVEHVADADFLTIFDNKELFAQIKPIFGQAPMVHGDSLKIRFRTENHWVMIAGTNGYFTSMMNNYVQDTLVGGNADRYRPATWYVNYPTHQLDIEATPLWRKESPLWDE